MKTLQQLSFIGLTVVLGMTSCTMEKRIYMPGYHIEWNKSKQNLDKQELSNKTAEQIQTVPDEQSGTATNSTDNASATSVNEENITASVDNEQIILSQKKKINLLSTHKIKNPNEENHTKSTFKSEFNKSAKMILSKEDEPKSNEIAKKGFICSLVLLPFGLSILGVIYSAIGLRKIRKNPTVWKGKSMAIVGLLIGTIASLFWAALAFIWTGYLLPAIIVGLLIISFIVAFT